MNRRRHAFLALAWLAIILCLGIYSAQALFVKGAIQFDLLALLPEGKTENMRLSNELMEDGNISGRLVIAFGHEKSEQAREALHQFREQLKTARLPILEHRIQQIETDYKALFSELYPYRAGLLSKEDRQLLLEGQDGILVKRALANIMSPISSFNASQLNSDPFGFYPRYVTSFLSDTSMETDGDGNMNINAEGKTWFLFQGEVTEKIFSLKLQEKISETLLPLLAKIEQDTGAEALRVGAAFYSSAGAQQAKSEISVIGLISTAGIILILLLVFRTPHPILFALAVILSGLIAGLAACIFFLGSMHILALVFGSSLVGVAVDYSLHYTCASFKSAHRFKVFSLLLPAMPLGVLTSAIGYGALTVAPFPGIQQMAGLACVGLLCTFISVAVWGPYFIKVRKAPILAERIQAFIERFAKLGSIRHLRPLIAAGLFSLFCAGFILMSFDDDVRNFQAMNPQLKMQEEKIKSMLNFNHSTKFLAVPGTNLETILRTEEVITQKLEGSGINCRALSDLIPSQQRQQENSDLKLYFCQNHFSKIAAALDADPTFRVLEGGFGGKAKSADAPFLINLPTGWKELVHIGDEGLITGRVMIHGKSDISTIGNHQGATYVDPVQEYSSLFASYRRTMLWLVAGLFATFALIIGLYKGFWASLSVAAPVLLSLLTTVGLFGLLGIPFSMFHAMGLILVLCIGIDYALFLYWRVADEKELLLLGNALAAITTILSFGLLILSATTAVYSFGLTVFIGITLNFFITTLLLGNIRCKKS